MFERLFSGEFYQELLSSDFNCGYVTGAGIVLGLLVLLLIVRLVLRILFRSRRCGAIVVPSPNGDLTISRNVVEKAARTVLDKVGELDIRRIQLYRKGKNYSLLLCCTFFDGGNGVPEIADGIRADIQETLRKLFGITTLKRIDFRVEEQGDAAPAAPEIRVPARLTDTGEKPDADSGL